MKARGEKGFTLLELLIVIAILAILAVILVLILNPAETLKKARDVQRLSDLATMKTAMGLILISSSTPYLDAGSSLANSRCIGGGGEDTIFYSYSSNDGLITDLTLDTDGLQATSSQASSTVIALTDGTGWLPVAFGWLPGKSPISALPLDPSNSIIDLDNISNSDLVYRYACNYSDATFEIDAVLESQAFTVSANKMGRDGGNNDSYYETGTALDIMGTTTSF